MADVVERYNPRDVSDSNPTLGKSAVPSSTRNWPYDMAIVLVPLRYNPREASLLKARLGMIAEPAPTRTVPKDASNGLEIALCHTTRPRTERFEVKSVVSSER